MAAVGQQQGLTPGARRFGVIGSPIRHSLSPLLHRTAYAVLGREDVVYERFEVPAGGLAAFLTAGEGRGLDGASITMPGKPEAFALAELRDGTSARLGIANTLLRLPGGGFRAENHDVHGIMATLRDHGVREPAVGAVIGSGATALSAVAAMLDLGARQLLLTARTRSKLAPLSDLARAAGARVTVVPWGDAAQVLAADVVISALALEGATGLADAWHRTGVSDVPAVFMDVLYDPWPAPLTCLLGAAGSEIADGLEMLAHQADMQLRSMLGIREAPRAEMLAAARAQLAGRA